MGLAMPANWRSKPTPGLVMRISVLISFLFHVVLLLSFEDAFPLFPDPEELRTFEVELVRPPVEDLDREQKTDLAIARPQSEPKPAAEETQETISLDTEDKRYVSYARLIKERIMMHWSYPPEARKNLIEGRLLAVFSLSKEGTLISLDIKHSSDHEVLDREATRAIRSASPFPPFPENIAVGRLNIEATFDYQITTKRHVRKG